jgi:GT2 family glycosyltransferase/glycosyltransferase involved in cell wall biosynthesis
MNRLSDSGMRKRPAESVSARTGTMLNPLDHPICFAHPKRVTPLSAWHEHIPFAMLLVDLLRPAVIVELGTESGDSYCAFCQAVKELKLDARCYAIDTWRGDSHAGFYDASILSDLRAHHDPLYGSFSTLIESSFDEALKYFRDGSINLLHIDGYHTYEAVRHDFESWFAKLSEDGIALFHDTNVRERDFGVSIFWDEIKQRYPHFEFFHGHGLGLLAAGKTRSKEFQSLLQSSDEEAIRVRDFFFQLGHRVTLHAESEKTQRERDEKERASAQLEMELASLKAHLAAERERAERETHQEERRKQNILQLFWHDGGFSEEHSLEAAIALDGEQREYAFRLPANARGPLRLDPGNRPGYAEISCIQLYACAAESNVSDSDSDSINEGLINRAAINRAAINEAAINEALINGGELIASWAADNDFAGLEPESGIARLAGNDSYRLFCFDEDPQLLLKSAPDRNDSRSWLLLVTLCAQERSLEIISGEIEKLEREAALNQKQLAAREAELERARAQSAEREKNALSLAAILAERERAFEAAEKRFGCERERFAEQMAARDKELRGQSLELGRALSAAERLAEQMAQQEKALAESQADSAERERMAQAQEGRLQSLELSLIEKEAGERALIVELNDSKSSEEKLRREIAEQSERSEAEREQLIRRIESSEQSIQALNSELDQRTKLIDEKDRLIQEKEDQLCKIVASFGWRLLNRYGRFKHGFLLPSFRRIRSAAEALARRSYHPALEAVHELNALSGSAGWESAGNDPQFNVAGRFPQGWAQITVDIETESGVKGRARLYVDRGSGYSEAESYDLGTPGSKQKIYAPLGREVVALRFDPFESRGKFKINNFTLKRVPALEAQKRNGHNAQPRALSRFIDFSLSRARNYRKTNGQFPSLAELPSAVQRTLRAWSATGRDAAAASAATTSPLITSPLATFEVPQPLDAYDAWLEVNQWNARREETLRDRLSNIAKPPLLSILMPVYDPPPEFLNKAIQSVARQVYQNWELCIADDASGDPAIISLLEEWAARDPRIRVAFRKQNGNISRATNSAAELARGDYLVLMDQDDEITPDALGEIALYVSERPETDIVYSDDDKINAEGQRFAPQFKPDWSPELLLSYMYFSHIFALRRSLFFEAGQLRVGYEGSQDYDLALRASEAAKEIGHIPKTLYHWRAIPGSTAASGSAKPDSFNAGLRAVQDALDRRGVRAEVYQPDWAVKAGCGIFAHRFPDDGPRVAIIIPTKNNVAVLSACIESLAKTTYKNYEVVIIDNESDDAETLEYLRQSQHRVLRIANTDVQFSFAAINNAAVKQADAEYALFLNNDTEVVAPEWLSQMVGYLGLPGVGAVGARLLYPDGRIQHAGITHGYYNGMAGPAFKLLPGWDHGYLSYTMVARNYSAATAACLLTRRDLFISLGGFDEKNFAVAYNDVDYCYRLQAAGHRTVYCPTAELIHHEGYSRGFRDNPAEPAAFRKKYGGRTDPFYNPNLSLADERFAIDARCVAPARLKPVRTLMCAFNLNWEGAPQSQFETTVRLKELGVIDPIAHSPHEGPLRAEYEARGIRVEIFEHPLRGVFDLAEYDRAIEKFARKIEDWKVELVYANTRQTFYAIDAAKRLGLPSIWNPRESEDWQSYFDYLGPEIAARALQCFAYPYKVIFVSDATRESCLPLNSHSNFITIPNGPDREKFNAALAGWPRNIARDKLGISPDETAILLLGTVCERKGQVDLIEAIARIEEQTARKIKCFIVGDRQSDYSERLRSAAESLPPSRRSRVEIVPETSDAAFYYSAADLFVLTSRIESFPRVILEAMMAGLPIIAAPVYGVREQVQENVNALFYHPGDAAELAEKIDSLVNDTQLRQRLAASSKHALDSLTDYESMVAAYGKVFREAWLSGRSR